MLAALPFKRRGSGYSGLFFLRASMSLFRNRTPDSRFGETAYFPNATILIELSRVDLDIREGSFRKL